MPKTLRQVTEELAEKRQTLHTVFEEAGEELDMSKVKVIDGDSAAKVDIIKAMNKELTALEKTRVELEGLETIKGDNDSVFNRELKERATISAEEKNVKPKSLGEMFFESKASEQKHTVKKVDFDTKTLFQTSAGWDPEATRIPRVEMYPLRPLVVSDYIPKGTTDADTIKYMKEGTFTNNAAEAAAGGQYGEAALAYTETSDEVEKIGVWLPVTDEQLEDVSGMTALLNNRLSYMLQARLDSQILNGDGSTPNLLGTVNLSSVQTQAKGGDPTPDAVFKAMTAIRATGFAEPSAVFLHPNDWQSIRLLRTADGIYIFGSPQDPGLDRIWGKPVVSTTAVTENTGIVGDYLQYSMLFIKRGVEFQVTNAHSDFFIKGKQAIRCDLRCSMVHFRDTAFCTVSSI